MAGTFVLFLVYSALRDSFEKEDALIYTSFFFFGCFFIATVIGPHSCDKHTVEKEKHVYHETDPLLFDKLKEVIKKSLPPRIVQGVQIKIAHPEKNKMEAKGVARNVKLEEEILPEEMESLVEDHDELGFVDGDIHDHAHFALIDMLNKRYKERKTGRKEFI